MKVYCKEHKNNSDVSCKVCNASFAANQRAVASDAICHQMLNTMPKDYQEVERIVEEFFTQQDEHGYSVDTAASGGDLNSKEYVRTFLTPKLLELLTTYGNARELEGVEKERERILSDILKWSTTVTVTETTGKGGAVKATKKLRENLAGCYHFLYQALRLTAKQ